MSTTICMLNLFLGCYVRWGLIILMRSSQTSHILKDAFPREKRVLQKAFLDRCALVATAFLASQKKVAGENPYAWSPLALPNMAPIHIPGTLQMFGMMEPQNYRMHNDAARLLTCTLLAFQSLPRVNLEPGHMGRKSLDDFQGARRCVKPERSWSVSSIHPWLRWVPC